MIDVHRRYIRALEDAGSLNRELEFLPSDEALAERRSEGIGLTAPEFAILLSYTKITLYKQLRDSDLPEDPYLSVELERYFPTLRANASARRCASTGCDARSPPPAS